MQLGYSLWLRGTTKLSTRYTTHNTDRDIKRFAKDLKTFYLLQH